MMPFMIMVIIQRLGILLLEMTPLTGVLRDILSFMTASAAGIFFFRMSCGGDALGLTTEPEPETEEDDCPVPSFPQRDTRFGQVMYTLICVGGLVVTMHVVSAAVGVQAEDVPDGRLLAAEFVSLVLIHPVLEEYLFRWLYYRELRPMQPIFAGLAQAVMFAIVHGSVGGMVYALFAGIVLVFVMEQSGSLAVAVISHMLVNLRSFVYLVWLTDGGVENAAQVRTVIDFCVVSVGFGAVLGLMVRRGLREVWNNADTGEDADDGE